MEPILDRRGQGSPPDTPGLSQLWLCADSFSSLTGRPEYVVPATGAYAPRYLQTTVLAQVFRDEPPLGWLTVVVSGEAKLVVPIAAMAASVVDR